MYEEEGRSWGRTFEEEEQEAKIKRERKTEKTESTAGFLRKDKAAYFFEKRCGGVTTQTAFTGMAPVLIKVCGAPAAKVTLSPACKS